jgi:hypothetical protein
MATVARRAAIRTNAGETLLGSKLQLLHGTAGRRPTRPSIALSILTGRVAEQLSIIESFYAADPVTQPIAIPSPSDQAWRPTRPHLVPRTVYLSHEHLSDITYVIEAAARLPESSGARRLTRSAVLRRAVEYLRAAVEADPAKSLWENQ